MSLNFEEDDARGRHRVLTASSLLSVVSATVLIDSLILVFSCLIIWSVGGYLMLSLIPFAILTLTVGLPTVWACVAVAVLAFHAETDPENN
ncbi:hypothetical protein [uncultured Roseibium sp.]|uniref:hypothetical protein n=1 Tax=uncultured Roseibium sp. TaxID=1936171 RepID=UPI002614BE4D|nr:hypothetical protein [uncultured Roseibium sp.]